MHINDFPEEILTAILEEAACLNIKQSVTFTFGFSEIQPVLKSEPLARYVRGPVQPEALRWDGASPLRHVCSKWHDWAIRHTMKNVSMRRWQGSERWAEITTRRASYSAYELIQKPKGTPVYRDPYGSLKNAVEFMSRYPSVADEVHRMFFDGYHTVQTDRMIFSILRSCRHLTSISLPWTLLRHGTAQDWIHLLGISSDVDVPLKSLELRAVCLTKAQDKDWSQITNTNPLSDPRVNFSQLKRLKIFGNTTLMPFTDEDIKTIARSATNLEEFHLTNLSTVSIAGVMAIVQASQSTLRVLEHSPRSDDGFFHPHPGHLDPDIHICEVLTSCPQLRDLSISLPTMCPALFSSESVSWEGECQVRALGLCPPSPITTTTTTTIQQKPKPNTLTQLRTLLTSSRNLITTQLLKRRTLDIELFFADCIFDPRDCVVHGDFVDAKRWADGGWPEAETSSAKGPYGTTGVYGRNKAWRDEIGEGEGERVGWTLVSEEEFLRAGERGWVKL